MIGRIQGTVVDRDKNTMTLMTTGGVGYRVTMTPVAIFELIIGQPIEVETYLKVSDSALELFGFRNHDERVFFELLLTVSGVGPKTALSILTLGPVDVLQNAIAREDLKQLTAVQGMGKKTAERLILELKGKFDASVRVLQKTTQENHILVDVIDGLVAMGYSQEEAKNATEHIDTTGKEVEQVLREVLRYIK